MLSTLLFILPVLVSFTAATYIPDCEHATINYPSESSLTQFTDSWRTQCKGYCAGESMHYGLSVNATKVASQAEVYCYCCEKSPATNQCWNERNPFSKDNIFGPVTYPTHNIVSKVTPPVQEVNRLSCNITPPPVVPCKGKHCSPPSPPSNPPCKGKHCEPPTKTPCKGKHCIDIDLPCIGLHCLPIKPCKGKHCDPSPPTKTPCKEDKWIHKKKEHKHKEHDWEWKPKECKHGLSWKLGNKHGKRTFGCY